MIRLFLMALAFGLLASCSSAPKTDTAELEMQSDQDKLYDVLNSRDNLAEMAQCFRDELDRNTDLPETVQLYVLFDVDEEGNPFNLRIGSARKYGKLEDCLSTRIGLLRFEGLRSRTSVKYPVTYRRSMSSAFSDTTAEVAI